MKTQICTATLMALAVSTANAAIQTYSGINGAFNSDSWNDAGNWTTAVPSGSDSAVIASGWTAAAVSGTSNSYSGGLTIQSDASLLVNGNDDLNAIGSGAISLDTSAVLAFRSATTTESQAISLTGSGVTIWTGQSTNSSVIDYTGGFLGAFDITLGGSNNAKATLSGASQFTSVTTTGDEGFAGENFILVSNASGALGTGDVAIIDTDSLSITAANAIADDATLILTGLASTKGGGGKLRISTGIDEVVGGLIVDGSVIDAGTYTNAESWLVGDGTLTIVPEPGSLALLGLGGLLIASRRRRG